MQSKFVWIFFTFYVLATNVATSTDPLRTRRDLTRIQNIIKWVLGINERKLIRTVPWIGNEQQRILTIPAYDKLFLGASTQVNGNIRHVLTEGPGRTYTPIQTIRNPFIYNSYPPTMHAYSQIRDRDYGYGRPIYPTNRLPTYQQSATPLCPISITNLEGCGYDTSAIITESLQPLPKPPMHIQNRMREIILNHPVHETNLPQDIVMPSSELRKVNVQGYSGNQDIIVVNDATPIKTEERLKTILSLKLKPEPNTDAQSVITDTDVITKNKVTFTAPVHSKYRYKMIYHNQPERNTVVEMDNGDNSGGSQTVEQYKTEISKPAVKDSADMMKNPANYIYVPPVNTEVPPPVLSSENSINMKSSDSDSYTAVASENKAIVTLNESPSNDAATKDKPTKVIIRRRKLKSRRENGRGDIPEISLQ